MVRHKVGRPPGELGVSKSMECEISSLQCFDTVGWATGRASGLQKTGCWFAGGDIFDWSLARLIAPVVTTTFATLNSTKIKNGDFLVPANPGPPGR